MATTMSHPANAAHRVSLHVGDPERDQLVVDPSEGRTQPPDQLPAVTVGGEERVAGLAVGAFDDRVHTRPLERGLDASERWPRRVSTTRPS